MGRSDIEISITAPGKIILFGEHSVVFGRKAIAAALGLQTKLHLKGNDSGNIALRFPPLNLEETFKVANIREYYNGNDSAAGQDPIQRSIERFREFYSKYGKNHLTDDLSNCLITLLHSFSYVTGACPGISIEVHTDLPIGFGAGSSASYSVVVSTAMLIYEYAESDKLQKFLSRTGDGVINISDEFRDLVSERAFLCEKLFHGTPSGVDHSVVIRGSALEFVKGVHSNHLETFDGGRAKILLVNTKVPKSTKRQVAILHGWKEKFPEASEHVLNAMETVAKDGVQTLKSMKDVKDLEKNERRLADLIELNHSLLRCIGVSHPSLEKVCEIARKFGLSAKLTGAGGGGLAIVYLPSEATSSTVDRLKDELREVGFDVTEADLGGPGLRIHSLTL
ncbi:UNVERIFIED_CONTAM: hypothetical protein PYX00_009162 [Menopon gallinae]|uniref:Mevalonate kinase n=1 Tax=Menopon gallinae TaxID=328185 RepID=A0AAW2HAH3_9NEOP